MADLIQTTVIERPDCSVCKAESPSSKPNPAIYDGKTVMGTREYMCQACFEVVGISSGQNRQLIVEGAPSGSISKLYLAVSNAAPIVILEFDRAIPDDEDVDNGIIRFDTESLMPSTECDGGMWDPACYCTGGCFDDDEAAEECLCTLDSGCYCGCDPNADLGEYRLQSITDQLGCPQDVGWYLIDDGTSDTVVRVMSGYHITPDGKVVEDEVLAKS